MKSRLKFEDIKIGKYFLDENDCLIKIIGKGSKDYSGPRFRVKIFENLSNKKIPYLFGEEFYADLSKRQEVFNGLHIETQKFFRDYYQWNNNIIIIKRKIIKKDWDLIKLRRIK